MAVDTTVSLRLMVSETAAEDLGTAQKSHLFEFPGTLSTGNYLTGTSDNKFDLVWSDTRSLAAAAESLDLYGVLTTKVTGTISMVELCGIFIRNESTTATSRLSVGAGANPSFTGLFGATGDIVIVPASGLFVFFAPLDGGGITVTNTTADILYIDSGAATITYSILLLGRSA